MIVPRSPRVSFGVFSGWEASANAHGPNNVFTKREAPANLKGMTKQCASELQVRDLPLERDLLMESTPGLQRLRKEIDVEMQCQRLS